MQSVSSTLVDFKVRIKSSEQARVRHALIVSSVDNQRLLCTVVFLVMIRNVSRSRWRRSPFFSMNNSCRFIDILPVNAFC